MYRVAAHETASDTSWVIMAWVMMMMVKTDHLLPLPIRPSPMPTAIFIRRRRRQHRRLLCHRICHRIRQNRPIRQNRQIRLLTRQNRPLHLRLRLCHHHQSLRAIYDAGLRACAIPAMAGCAQTRAPSSNIVNPPGLNFAWRAFAALQLAGHARAPHHHCHRRRRRRRRRSPRALQEFPLLPRRLRCSHLLSCQGG